MSRRAAAGQAQQGLLSRMAEQLVHPQATTNVEAALARRARAAVPPLPAASGAYLSRQHFPMYRRGFWGFYPRPRCAAPRDKRAQAVRAQRNDATRALRHLLSSQF